MLEAESSLSLPNAEIIDKLIDALVSLRMADHLAEELRWNHYDISPSRQGFVDVVNVVDTANNDLRRHRPFLEDLVNLLNYKNAS